MSAPKQKKIGRYFLKNEFHLLDKTFSVPKGAKEIRLAFYPVPEKNSTPELFLKNEKIFVSPDSLSSKGKNRLWNVMFHDEFNSELNSSEKQIPWSACEDTDKKNHIEHPLAD